MSASAVAEQTATAPFRELARKSSGGWQMRLLWRPHPHPEVVNELIVEVKKESSTHYYPVDPAKAFEDFEHACARPEIDRPANFAVAGEESQAPVVTPVSA